MKGTPAKAQMVKLISHPVSIKLNLDFFDFQTKLDKNRVAEYRINVILQQIFCNGVLAIITLARASVITFLKT